MEIPRAGAAGCCTNRTNAFNMIVAFKANIHFLLVHDCTMYLCADLESYIDLDFCALILLNLCLQWPCTNKAPKQSPETGRIFARPHFSVIISVAFLVASMPQGMHKQIYSTRGSYKSIKRKHGSDGGGRADQLTGFGSGEQPAVGGVG